MNGFIQLSPAGAPGAGVPAGICSILQAWEAQGLLCNLDTRTMLETADRLATSSERRGIANLGDLGQHAEALVRDTSGVEHLTRFTNAQESRKTNSSRNLLVALIVHMAMAAGKDPKKALQGLPKVMAENGESGRAAHDDEILLLRLRALHRLTRTGTAKLPAIQYILVEAGAFPSETTVVTMSDFDLTSPDEATVTLPGVGTADIRAARRTVALPRWAVDPLTAALHDLDTRSHGGTPEQPVAYRGTRAPGGHKASATASGNLARLIREAGLDGRGLTGLSPNRWRLMLEARSNGLRAAQAVGGKHKVDGLLTHLHNPDLDLERPKERVRGNIARLKEAQAPASKQRG